MWDGTLSGQEFHAESLAFLELCNREHTTSCQWQWQPRAESTATGYLTLEDVPTASATEDARELQSNLGDDDYPPDPTDAAAMIPDPLIVQQYALLTYHVIYSESYRVPILFFRGHLSDGRPLNLENMQSILTTHSTQLLEKSRWTYLTQEEHPFLHRPWFMFHPCGTSSLMTTIFAHRPGHEKRSLDEEKRTTSGRPVAAHLEISALRDKEVYGPPPDDGIQVPPDEKVAQLEPRCFSGQYLIAWMSVVRQVARLELPLSLFKAACT